MYNEPYNRPIFLLALSVHLLTGGRLKHLCHRRNKPGEVVVSNRNIMTAFLLASFDAILGALDGGTGVRTTIALDDELVAKAQAFTGLQEKSALVREALKALIERESARRLARLGGTEPDLKPIPRRQTDAQ